ncbi:hypothetical protein F444_19446 [Phytophthora nicotianae P1976]|uniref:Uncharacterized protein n=1 Tax=Phytophthora nicotianae P1976 TaxID=1317066 RepID=A0A080Z7R8_PHYNI|nr:hypothetical protein F444_19446 [Phytophthora nicotianae P1976]
MSEAWEFTTRNDHSATSKQTIVVILGAAQRSQSIAPDLDDRLDCFVENLRRRAQLTRTNDERVRGDFIQNDYAYTDENYDDDDASIQVEVATDENGSGWERRRTGIQRRARATTQSVILRRVRSKRNLQGSLLRHNNQRQQDKRESWHCTFEEGEYVEDEDGKTCCGVDVTLSDHLVSSATNNKPDNTATERQARKLEQNQ